MTPSPFIHVVCYAGNPHPYALCANCCTASRPTEAHVVFTVTDVVQMPHTKYDACVACGVRFILRGVRP